MFETERSKESAWERNLNDVNLVAVKLRRSDDGSGVHRWCSHSSEFAVGVSVRRKKIYFMVVLDFGFGFWCSYFLTLHSIGSDFTVLQHYRFFFSLNLIMNCIKFWQSAEQIVGIWWVRHGFTFEHYKLKSIYALDLIFHKPILLIWIF